MTNLPGATQLRRGGTRMQTCRLSPEQGAQVLLNVRLTGEGPSRRPRGLPLAVRSGDGSWTATWGLQGSVGPTGLRLNHCAPRTGELVRIDVGAGRRAPGKQASATSQTRAWLRAGPRLRSRT